MRWLPWVMLALCAGCQCGVADDGNGGPDAGLVTPDAGAEFDAGDPDAGPCGALVWPAPAGCTATDLEGKLRCVPNLHVSLGTPAPPGYVRYDLVFRQQVDAANPDAGSFDQRAVLLYVDAAAPMVLRTSGYELSVSVGELARTFRANVLTYEHRYFQASRPVPTDWSQLTIRQAADDAHAMVQALRWIFPARWINSGESKGGMTAVYQRRFHTCDVDATLAYVAPVSFGTLDPGYGTFLQGVGGSQWASCRAGLEALQRRLLTERAQLVPLMAGNFTLIPVAKAFELAVVELPFAFWQYTAPGDPLHGCAALPGQAATAQDLADFLTWHSAPSDLASDEALAWFAPYYYQAQRQLGAPAPYELPVAGLLTWPGADVASTFIPPGVPVPVFEPPAMPDVDDWLDAHGERVMLVYGELDPWSTHQIPLGRAVDSYVYVAPGDNHFARLGTLAAADKQRALDTLTRWLRRAVVATPHARADLEPPEPRVPR